MRKFLSVVWHISAGVLTGAGLMFVGAATADAVDYYAGAAAISMIIFGVGFMVMEIDERAFDRGYEAKERERKDEDG